MFNGRGTLGFLLPSAIALLSVCYQPVRADVLYETVVPTDNGYRIGNLSASVNGAGEPSLLFTYIDPVDTSVQHVAYATREQLGWSIEVLDAGSFTTPRQGLAIDSTGRPHIVYLDTSSRRVVYGVKNPDGWSYETIGSGDVATWPAMDLDSTGKPYVLMLESTADSPTLFSRSGPGVWDVQPSLLPDRIIGANDIDVVLDKNDKPYIAYATRTSYTEPDYLVVATRDENQGGALVIDYEIARDYYSARFNSIEMVVDTDGYPRVLATLNTTRDPYIEHFSQKDAGWGLDLSIKDARYHQNTASIGVNELGQSVILHSRFHINVGSGDVELWTLIGNEFSREQIASGMNLGGDAPGYRVDMITDDHGGVHMFYLTDVTRGVSYAFVPEPMSLMTCTLAFCLIGLRGHE